jgi:hypothetical protein
VCRSLVLLQCLGDAFHNFTNAQERQANGESASPDCECDHAPLMK